MPALNTSLGCNEVTWKNGYEYTSTEKALYHMKGLLFLFAPEIFCSWAKDYEMDPILSGGGCTKNLHLGSQLCDGHLWDYS